jgi:hypothetical protein
MPSKVGKVKLILSVELSSKLDYPSGRREKRDIFSYSRAQHYLIFFPRKLMELTFSGGGGSTGV